MKLLRATACRLAVVRGNVSKATVMGDAMMEESSDRGSIPLSSTLAEAGEYNIFQLLVSGFCMLEFIRRRKDSVFLF